MNLKIRIPYYHGTSIENGKNIIENGFRVTPSAEMIMGVGLYLTPDIGMAERYATELRDVETGRQRGSRKGMVLRVDMPGEMRVCSVREYEAIPLEKDMIVNETAGKDIRPSELQSLKKSIKEKHEKMIIEKKREMLGRGCDAAKLIIPVPHYFDEIVIYNDKIIKNLHVTVEKMKGAIHARRAAEHALVAVSGTSMQWPRQNIAPVSSNLIFSFSPFDHDERNKLCREDRGRDGQGSLVLEIG